MKTKLKSLLIILLILTCISCNKKNTTYEQAVNLEKINIPHAKKERQEVTVLALGDDLIHEPIITNSYKDGKFDFSFLFKHLKEDIEKADLACINQETMFIKNPALYSGYPNFGGPTDIGIEIANCGFDIVTHATNHSFDKGEQGIKDTLDFWKTKPKVTVLGLHSSQEDADNIKIIEKNGIKIALFNYTYGLNGYVLPKGKGYLVDLLENKERIAKLLKKAETEADFTIVFMHAGNEYVYKPTAYQKEWASFFSENGADLVIGHHPHVIESMEIHHTEQNNFVPVFYSIGNYISFQNEMPRMLGMMLKLTITKIDGKTQVSSYNMCPLVTHIQKNADITTFETYKLADYNTELAKKHFLNVYQNKDVYPESLWNLYKHVYEPKISVSR